MRVRGVLEVVVVFNVVILGIAELEDVVMGVLGRRVRAERLRVG